MGILLAGTAALLPACQGEEPYGNPEYCYFILQTSAVPGQDESCPPGGSLGYDLHFRDENGTVTTFNNLTVPNSSAYLLNLPAGHTYEAFVISNGNQSGGCTSLYFDAYIISPEPLDTCARLRLWVEERPEIISYNRPDAMFSIPDVCRGCTKVAQPEPSCQSSTDCEDSNDSVDGACTVPLNGYVSGSLNDALDVDWYRLYAPAGQNCVDLYFSPPSGNSNYRVELYRNGQLVAGPDPNGLFYCSLPNTTQIVYYIKVYGIEGSYDPRTCYSFQADTYNQHW
jgi:hypothetical protein